MSGEGGGLVRSTPEGMEIDAAAVFDRPLPVRPVQVRGFAAPVGSLYWRDGQDRLECVHGTILYGTSCVKCERGDFPPFSRPGETEAFDQAARESGLASRHPVDLLEEHVLRPEAARLGVEVDEEALAAARAHCDELVPLPVTGMRAFSDAIAPALMAEITAFCVGITERRPPNQLIGRVGNPYIDRWFLARKGQVPLRSEPPQYADLAPFMPSEIENLYLHRYHRGDADEPHDHPWPNASLIVRGYYREAIYDDGGGLLGTVTRHRGDIVLRSATSVHAILETSDECLSLFATLPKERDWGFWTASGFVPWRRFGNP